MIPPSVYVVVLNWNNASDSIGCIESIVASDYKDTHVVFCDNGSTDGSVQKVESWARRRFLPYSVLQGQDVLTSFRHDSARFTIIRNRENLGYARGNNVGIRFAQRRMADYVFILNNDAMLSQTAISSLVAFGEQHPDAALMAPRILEPDFGGSLVACSPAGWENRPSVAEYLMPRSLRHRSATCAETTTPPNWPMRLYYAPGCAMMFRAETFAIAGLFDESTFLYYEEFIMAEKLRRAGLATYYVPGAEVRHLHGASTAQLTPAVKYINSVVSQKYYVTQYLGFNLLSLAVLSLKVTVSFLVRALSDAGYRRNVIHFLRSYY